MNLRQLEVVLSHRSQGEFYENLGFSYEKLRGLEDCHSSSGNQAVIRLLDWKSRPTKENLKRLFNQINTFYAERLVLSEEVSRNPRDVLSQINSVILFRQGKRIGARLQNIAFGRRPHLDFLDPRRSYQWLYGVDPQYIEKTLSVWGGAVDQAPKEIKTAVALAMVLIAIHPFSDGNGRAARVAFLWLCERWGLQRMWLAEGSDGEFLRTGSGISSTEYLMAMYMLSVGDSNNSVEPSGNRQKKNVHSIEFYRSVTGYLERLKCDKLKYTENERLEQFLTYLMEEGHLLYESPRFHCLHYCIEF